MVLSSLVSNLSMRSITLFSRFVIVCFCLSRHSYTSSILSFTSSASIWHFMLKKNAEIQFGLISANWIYVLCFNETFTSRKISQERAVPTCSFVHGERSPRLLIVRCHTFLRCWGWFDNSTWSRSCKLQFNVLPVYFNDVIYTPLECDIYSTMRICDLLQCELVW